MYITQCVLALLTLHAGLAHSFSWDLVTHTTSRLEFYDVNGILTHTEDVTSRNIVGAIETITYDPVHDRVLFADSNNIYSFKIASKSIETLLTIANSSINSFGYDPATELLYWNEEHETMFSISLKPGLNNRVNEKHLILSENNLHEMTVDICGGFIYWISALNIQRARFDGSGRQAVTGRVSGDFININQQARKVYWYDNLERSVSYADLNGKNTREVYQRRRPRGLFENKQFTFAKDHTYWKICDKIYINCTIWKIPNNARTDIDLLIESNLFIERDAYIWGIAAKYSIEDLTRGVQNCERLKSLLPSNTVTNVSSDVSLLCVHGTKVSGESRCECAQGYSGERCDVLV